MKAVLSVSVRSFGGTGTGAAGMMAWADRRRFGLRVRGGIWSPLRLIRLSRELESEGVVMPSFRFRVGNVRGGRA